jgi:hypothetical protein
VLLGATPASQAAPKPVAGPELSVVCAHTPFYLFVAGSDRPVRAHVAGAALGQRFALVAGPRTTLEGFQYYETGVPVVEPGYPPGAHYWISRDCAVPSR